MRSRSLVVALLALIAALLTATPAGATHGDKPTGSAAATPESAAPEAAPLTGLTQVQAGYNVSCARTGAGQVRCWGDNDDGELGHGDTNPHQYAVTVRAVSGPGNLSGVTQIAVGDDHACALLTNHQVRCWGDNDYGELGNGDATNNRSRPVAVRNAGDTGNLVNVTSISAESDGVCALLTNHQVRCWGEDDYGQLGNGAPVGNSDLPVTVKGVGGTGALTNVRSIEMAYDNNCAVLMNGQARCWGYNGEGELGNGHTTDTFAPVVVRSVSGGGPLTGVTRIAAGGYQACALLTTGQARCWGQNDDGEVGDGTLNERDLPVVLKNASGSGPLLHITSITGGYDHFCALISGGQVRCWGDTESGQVGDGTPLSGPVRKLPRPVRAVSGPGNLTDVVQIHSNQAHTCALLNTGQARCWGYNSSGQLGNGGSTAASRPVRVLI